MTKTNMTNKLIKRSAISRRKNLLSALDKAFNELNEFTQWLGFSPDTVEYNC